MLSRVLWPRHPMLLVIWSRHPILSESFLLKHLMLSAGEEQPHCCRSRSMYPRTQSVLTQLWNYVPRDPDLWVLTQLWTYVPQDTLSVVCLDPALWPMYPGPRPLSVALTQFSDPCTQDPDLWVLCWPSFLRLPFIFYTQGGLFVLESHHTSTATKTWVTYRNTHLACV